MSYKRQRLRSYPQLESQVLPSHGEARFAAEATLAQLRGHLVPQFAQHRAFQTLQRLAGEF